MNTNSPQENKILFSIFKKRGRERERKEQSKKAKKGNAIIEKEESPKRARRNLLTHKSWLANLVGKPKNNLKQNVLGNKWKNTLIKSNLETTIIRVLLCDKKYCNLETNFV